MIRAFLLIAVLLVPSAAHAEIQSPFGQKIGQATREIKLNQHPFATKNPFGAKMPSSTGARNAMKANQQRAAHFFNGDQDGFNVRKNWKSPTQTGLKKQPDMPQQNIGDRWKNQSQNPLRNIAGNN